MPRLPGPAHGRHYIQRPVTSPSGYRLVCYKSAIRKSASRQSVQRLYRLCQSQVRHRRFGQAAAVFDTSFGNPAISGRLVSRGFCRKSAISPRAFTRQSPVGGDFAAPRQGRQRPSLARFRPGVRKSSLRQREPGSRYFSSRSQVRHSSLRLSVGSSGFSQSFVNSVISRLQPVTSPAAISPLSVPSPPASLRQSGGSSPSTLRKAAGGGL